MFSSKDVPILIVSWAFMYGLALANIKAHFPASEGTTFPRLRLVESLPRLREFTLCSWVKSYHLTGGCSAILSYASNKYDNEIVVELCKGSQNMSITLWRGKNHVSIQCNYKWKRNSWYHVCVSWFGYGDVANAFVNGQKCHDVEFISDDVVPTGGMLVVGQEQDAFDSKFEHHSAFSGDLADYQLWDEALNESQIEEVAKCGRKKGRGNVISWMKTSMVPVDGVVISQTELCAW